MIYVGIDPGASGAICELDYGMVRLMPLSATEADVAAFLRMLAAKRIAVTALIEKVHSMPKQGVASSFKFGTSYGFLRGVLAALEIPFDDVSPQKWQRALGCMSGGDKNVTKGKAQQLYPHVHVTHQTADALLIAEYARRLSEGKL